MEYRIVIVDDDSMSANQTRNMLIDEEADIVSLESGNALLEYIKDNTADVILLDIIMPDMDGIMTFKALRSYEKEAGKECTPVIFLTGEEDEDIERRALESGAAGFVRKPFNKDILINRIHNTIDINKGSDIMSEDSMYDELSGFLNRVHGIDQVTKLCEESSGTLMIIDLDNFKLVNDFYGHGMGDKILKAFAEIVRRNIRGNDVIARIGGDEFLGFFGNVTEETAIASLASRLNSQFVEESNKILGEDHGIPLGTSLGAVMVPEYGRDFDALFDMADSALYTIKQNGKHGYFIYEQLGSGEVFEGDELEQEIERITGIVEERDDKTGALLLGREAFATAYRLFMRFYKRYGGNCVKILFALSVKEGVNERELYEAVAHYGVLLQKELRKSDLIMQNRPNQFFVFLNEKNQIETESVINRITDAWRMSEYSGNIKVEYAYKYIEFEGVKPSLSMF